MKCSNGKCEYLLAVLIIATASLSKALPADDCEKVLFDIKTVDKICDGNHSSEVLRQITQYPEAFAVCCIPGTQTESKFLKLTTTCHVTSCTPLSIQNPCASLPEFYFNGHKVTYENLGQETCSISKWWWPFSSEEGSIALCCPSTSPESWLVSMAGAEKHEFPHQALLTADEYCCGATVYNRRFLITSAHCVLHYPSAWIPRDVSTMRVMLDSNIRNIRDSQYIYGVKKAIPHPFYEKAIFSGRWTGWEDNRASFVNDIALVELDRDIEFGENVKALEIAPKNFNPFEFGDQIVFIGWGSHDNQWPTSYLRKHTVKLRNDLLCSQRLGNIYEGKYWQLLCAGGMINGEYSPPITAGDSGGPAICRGENGHPVLYGVTSFSANLYDCQKNWDELYCPPNVFAKVSYFRDWIQDLAGPQVQDTLYKPFLFGRNVNSEEYLHQVRITAGMNDSSCGGTLIQPDVVITSAHCVFDANTGFLRNVTVKSRAGNVVTVKGAQALPNFQLGITVDQDPIFHRVIDESIYKSDLAVLILNGSLDIPRNKLARLPNVMENFTKGAEVAVAPDGSLRAREFTLLTTNQCEERLRRARLNIFSKIDDPILCGVEKYSGSSTCDRELGGGLLCTDKDGQDVLCGIPNIRLCISSLPNGFLNIGHYVKWIEDTILELRFSTQSSQGFLDTYYRLVFKSFI